MGHLEISHLHFLLSSSFPGVRRFNALIYYIQKNSKREMRKGSNSIDTQPPSQYTHGTPILTLIP
jgi:hypothetical protein